MPQNLHADAVKFIIGQLAKQQSALVGTRYHFVDSRGLLGRHDWCNELHPTAEGFNKIARPFYPVLEKYFPDWVRKPKWYWPKTRARRCLVRDHSAGLIFLIAGTAFPATLPGKERRG